MNCFKCGQNTNNLKYCSNECRKKEFKCANCNVICSNRHSRFCSRKCFTEANYSKALKEWKEGKKLAPNSEVVSVTIRKYLFEKFYNKCSNSDCNWSKINPVTGKIPLQVDHIDGDSSNNLEENLRLLCPNCHSLTPTYGSLNKGNGRKKRKLRRASIV